MLEVIQAGPVDPMFVLKKRADGDTSDKKVDLGVGVYRSEKGTYHELGCVREAKKILEGKNLGHDYELTTGDAAFLRLAAGVMFGEDSRALADGRISSVQTLSGTGACHLAVLLLATSLLPENNKPTVYIGIPNWSNTAPLVAHVGLKSVTYRHFDPTTRRADFASLMAAANAAAEGSVFFMQVCCHNPTGADFSADEWREIGRVMCEKKLFPLLDIAYQGLGDGVAEDAAGVRILSEIVPEMLVAQSFSKNMALYGERCGVLHVLARNKDEGERVKDRLRSIIRREFSSSPAYGSRLVRIVLEDEKLRRMWHAELEEMRARLKTNRAQLQGWLVDELRTPGDWTHITREKGLFSYLSLSEAQCRSLMLDYSIYLPLDGRINIAGLAQGNIERTARAIDEVARKQEA